VIKLTVQIDSALLTRTAVHPVPSSQFADEARDNHAFGNQRARQSFELFNVDAHSLCLWVELAIPFASGNSGYPCIAQAAGYSGVSGQCGEYAVGRLGHTAVHATIESKGL
jgi:hypothetical protein